MKKPKQKALLCWKHQKAGNVQGKNSKSNLTPAQPCFLITLAWHTQLFSLICWVLKEATLVMDWQQASDSHSKNLSPHGGSRYCPWQRHGIKLTTVPPQQPLKWWWRNENKSKRISTVSVRHYQQIVYLWDVTRTIESARQQHRKQWPVPAQKSIVARLYGKYRTTD